jgi:hypothetical protein
VSSANSAIKTHYGYAGSEDRSQTERQAAAHRIVAKADPEIEGTGPGDLGQRSRVRALRRQVEAAEPPLTPNEGA